MWGPSLPRGVMGQQQAETRAIRQLGEQRDREEAIRRQRKAGGHLLPI